MKELYAKRDNPEMESLERTWWWQAGGHEVLKTGQCLRLKHRPGPTQSFGFRAFVSQASRLVSLTSSLVLLLLGQALQLVFRNDVPRKGELLGLAKVPVYPEGKAHEKKAHTFPCLWYRLFPQYPTNPSPPLSKALMLLWFIFWKQCLKETKSGDKKK